MKKLIPLLFMSVYFSPAQASDKDILRDACSAVKIANKRSECFNALERISTSSSKTPAVATTQQPATLKLNSRAFGECAAIEYAEIDSMPRHELEGLYCSYAIGSDTVSRINNASVEKASDPRIKAALLGDLVRSLERCNAGLSKALSAFNRKYPGEKPDCTEMKAKIEANREAYQKKKEAEAQ